MASRLCLPLPLLRLIDRLKCLLPACSPLLGSSILGKTLAMPRCDAPYRAAELSSAAAPSAAACPTPAANHTWGPCLPCSHAGVALQAGAALFLAAGLQTLLAGSPPAKAAAPAAQPTAAAAMPGVPKTPTSLGPPLRGGRSQVVGPPTGGMEASPAGGFTPSSTGRPSPYGSRHITTPEQLRRVMVSPDQLALISQLEALISWP